MITDRYAEKRIRSWLIATAPRHLPDRVLTDTYERTRRMAQASRPRTWWSRTMRPLQITFAAAAIAVVLVAVSVGLGTRELDAPAQPVSATIGGLWSTDPRTAVTIERDPNDDGRYYWRGAAYDRIDLHGLSSSTTTTVERTPGTPVLDGMADAVDGAGLKQISFTVRPEAFTARAVLSPATPLFVDRSVRLTTIGQDGYFTSIERNEGGPYTVTALVPDPDSPDGPTDAALRGAGTDYPAELVMLYTAELPGMFGPNLRALRDEVIRTANSRAPYDIAQRLVEVLHSDTYRYDTDVRDVDCGPMSTPECFAMSKRGYCLHYATTMAVILRNLGVPTRVVSGFLPGERAVGSSVEVINASRAHAWVEVYLPGYAWVAFDPTGGGVAG